MNVRLKAKKPTYGPNAWFIPKETVLPKYDAGEITDSRKQALELAKIEKKKADTERNRKMDAFRKQMGWA